MAILEKINRNYSFYWGEENTVASFYKWLSDIFDHDGGYKVYFDSDRQEFINRSNVVFPSILVKEIDTQDLVTSFIGGKNNKAKLLFYVYFNHHLQHGGSRQLLRRGRDQLSYCFKMAGQIDSATGSFYVNPIYVYDFSKKPPEKKSLILTIEPGIQQRFIQDGEVLQYEFMISLSYIEPLTDIKIPD